MDWLARVYTPAWLHLAGLTERAQRLEAAPEVTDPDTLREALELLEAGRRDARTARARAFGAPLPTGWAAPVAGRVAGAPRPPRPPPEPRRGPPPVGIGDIAGDRARAERAPPPATPPRSRSVARARRRATPARGPPPTPRSSRRSVARRLGAGRCLIGCSRPRSSRCPSRRSRRAAPALDLTRACAPRAAAPRPRGGFTDLYDGPAVPVWVLDDPGSKMSGMDIVAVSLLEPVMFAVLLALIDGIDRI